MASNYWAKIYIEILDDRKVMTLPESLRWRFIECILLARELSRDNTGYLPSIDDMSWRLRLQPDSLQADLSRLAQAGLLEIAEDGRWFIRQFEKRQSTSSNAERQRLWRDRNATVTKRYADVTPTLRQITDIDKDTDTDTDTDDRRDDGASAIKTLDEHFYKAAGVFPGGNYQANWQEPLEAIYQMAGNDVELATRLIDEALVIARAGDKNGKPYTVSSPKSIANIARNLTAAKRAERATNGADAIWQSALSAIKARRYDDERLKAAIRAVGGTGAISGCNERDVPQMRMRLFNEYQRINTPA